LIDENKSMFVHPTLLVDVGGVGDAVGDNLARDITHPFVRYKLTGGTAQTFNRGQNYTVPRTEMFNQLYAAFANNRIHINPRLKHAETLIKELRNLTPQMSEETGAVKVVHRTGEHDDLAICLASTNWLANLPRNVVRAVNDERTLRKLMGAR